MSLLKKLGYVRISEAEHGAMALRTFESAKAVGAPIGFVISAWDMPVMDGPELLKAIRTSSTLSELPVLIVATGEPSDNVVAAVQAGADDYVERPLEQSTLMKKLERIQKLKSASGR